jgi:hypothetical protein
MDGRNSSTPSRWHTQLRPEHQHVIDVLQKGPCPPNHRRCPAHLSPTASGLAFEKWRARPGVGPRNSHLRSCDVPDISSYNLMPINSVRAQPFPSGASQELVTVIVHFERFPCDNHPSATRNLCDVASYLTTQRTRASATPLARIGRISLRPRHVITCATRCGI